MMDEKLKLLYFFLAGVGLGLVFFGGLWLTVKKGLRAKQSGLIFTLSFVVRMGIVLAAFYYIVRFGWQYILVCLAGFIITRAVMVRLSGKISAPSVDLIKNTQHET